MKKKLAALAVSVFILTNLYGCFALLAGAAAGGGTAFWLSGKLTDHVNASYDRTVKATEKAMKDLCAGPMNKVYRDNVTQFRCEDNLGKNISVDVFRASESSTKLEIRVSVDEREAAQRVLDHIKRYL
jgi:hypothetical protein